MPGRKTLVNAERVVVVGSVEPDPECCEGGVAKAGRCFLPDGRRLAWGDRAGSSGGDLGFMICREIPSLGII